MSQEHRNSKSLPPLSNQHSYIDKSIRLFNHGCYNNQQLKIDDSIGDYRMKLFRTKDKKQYIKNIKTIFTSSFTESLLPKDTHSRDIRDQIQKIISKPIDASLQQTKQFLQSQRVKNKIVVKDEGEFSQRTEVKHEKGSYMSTLQEDDYLICHYIPEYQRKKWFQLKNSNTLTPIASDVNDGSHGNKGKRRSVIKISNKSKHIFAYLSNPIYLSKPK